MPSNSSMNLNTRITLSTVDAETKARANDVHLKRPKQTQRENTKRKTGRSRSLTAHRAVPEELADRARIISSYNRKSSTVLICAALSTRDDYMKISDSTQGRLTTETCEKSNPSVLRNRTGQREEFKRQMQNCGCGSAYQNENLGKPFRSHCHFRSAPQKSGQRYSSYLKIYVPKLKMSNEVI